MSVDIFRNQKEVVSFSAGETIFTEGEPGAVMYGVIEGEVNIYVGQQLMDTESPGGIFGEMALIDSSARSATAIARTDCKLAPIDQKHFQFLVQQTPYFAIQVMHVMAERIRKANVRTR
jgi:CRP/FNR family cyclic AMP-dependent transcriptional regulator